MIVHPSDAQLNRFADGELSGRQWTRTAGHLERCSECRNTVGSIRRLSRQASTLAGPVPPADLKDRILARLERGEQVILPVADPPRPAMPVRRVAVALAATVTLAVAASIFRARPAMSEAGELSISPEQYQPGQELTFAYRATSRFTGDDTLVVRSVYRTPADGNTWHDDLPVHRVGTLVRESDGVYRGTLTLPDDVVYAPFAVEDLKGREVDSRGHRYWEVLAHEDGKPTYDALMQMYYDLALRNDEAARETAQKIIEWYPDKPGGWYALSSLELQFYGDDFAAQVGPKHLQKFDDLEQKLGLQDHPSEADVEMYSYALTLGDSSAARRWRERALQMGPGEDRVKEILVHEVMQQVAGQEPRHSLQRLEALWNEGDFRRTSLPDEGFRAALTSGDTVAMERWLNRVARARPSEIKAWVTQAAAAPGGQGVASRYAESLLARFDGQEETRRALYRTVDQQERFARDRRNVLTGILGRALVAQGDPGSVSRGLDYLNTAQAGTWSVELFSQAAQIHRRLGNVAAAFELWARVAVDAWTPSAVADSLEAMAERELGADAWSGLVDEAHAFRAEYYLDRVSGMQFIPLDIQVRADDSSSHSLDELMDGRITVLAFWSRNDYFAMQDVDSLSRVAADLESYDATLIILVQEAPSDDWAEFAAERALPPVYHDVNAEALQAFEVWGSPVYFVVDGEEGRVRFSRSHVGELVNQVAVLRFDEEQAATPLVTEDADRPH